MREVISLLLKTEKEESRKSIWDKERFFEQAGEICVILRHAINAEGDSMDKMLPAFPKRREVVTKHR